MIINGKDRGLDQSTGTLPDVSGALLNWFQPLTFEKIVKSTVNFKVAETTTPVVTQGVVQQFTARQLMMKPEGQRAWSWWKIHALPDLVLCTDDVILYLGKQYRVKNQNDYSAYGYVEYDVIQDYTGAGP